MGRWACFFLLCLTLGNTPLPAQVTPKDRLEEAFLKRQHVRYQFGGCSKTRMDCSCFVQRTFKESFGLSLPRSTFLQVHRFRERLLPGLSSMRKLASAELCVGDLIYTYRKGSWAAGSRHVAIYLGDSTILHAARNVGVVKQSLKVLSHHQLYGVVRLLECSAPAS